MGAVIPIIVSTTCAVIGMWITHDASKSLADGEGTYTTTILLLVLGVCIVLTSGVANKMLE